MGDWLPDFLNVQLWGNILLIGALIFAFGFFISLFNDIRYKDKKSIKVIMIHITSLSFLWGFFTILISLIMLFITGIYNAFNDHVELINKNIEIVKTKLEETMETVENYHNVGWNVYIDGQKVEEINSHSINIWNYDISYDKDSKKIYLKSK